MSGHPDPTPREDPRSGGTAPGRRAEDPAWWVEPDAVETVDATGLRCPIPVIRLATAARDLEPGTVIMLLSTDPAAGPDVAAWCRMRGHELLGQKDHGPVLASRVRLSGTRAAGARSGPPPDAGGTRPG